MRRFSRTTDDVQLTRPGSREPVTRGDNAMADSRTTSGSRIALVLIVTIASACRRSAAEPDGPKAIRLVDAFDAKLVEGSPGKPAAAPPRTEWRVDRAAPRPAPPPPGPPPPPRPRLPPRPA